MTNHVHLVVDLASVGQDAEVKERQQYVLTEVLKGLKSYTGLRANRILGREGDFWQHESYDHLVRNCEELELTIWYVLNNPVKARLANDWHEWRWSYCKPGLI